MHPAHLASTAATDAYRLVFTAEAFPYPAWWIGLPGLLFVTIGAVLARAPDLWADGTTGTRGLARPFMAFGALFTVVGTCTPYAAHTRVARALRAGAYLTVEGVVRDFEPGSEAGHRPERFRVTTADRDYAYEYSPARVTGGFSRTREHGGPVRAGVRVRIADVDGAIARLEVAAPAAR